MAVIRLIPIYVFVGILMRQGINSATAATLSVDDAASLRSAMRDAQPGDVITLAPGVYAGRFEAIGMSGVTFRSENPAERAVIDGAGFGEGIKLSASSDVTLSDLIIQGAELNAINIDDGGASQTSKNISIENVLIRSVKGVGIKLAGVDNFHIDRVFVIGWGSDASAITAVGAHQGLIERSLFQNRNAGVGTGVVLKGGSSEVVVRGNRFIDANERAIQFGGETELTLFRPLPPGDVEGRNLVAEGNLILSNGNDAPGIRSAVAFVNVADGVFRNNVIVRPSDYVMRILKENRQTGFIDTQNGTFEHNIVVWESGDLVESVNAGSRTKPATFRFDGNQWFNRTNPGASMPSLPSVEQNGIYGLDPGVDDSTLVAWDFDWGKWVVNTTSRDLPFTIDADQALFLAIPSAESELNLSLGDPLVGDWSLSPIESPTITLESYSYALFMKQRQRPTCDLNSNGSCDVGDIDMLLGAIRNGSEDPIFDLDGSGVLDDRDRDFWVDELFVTYYGDANLDGEFSSTDLVAVFQAAEYEDETASNSSWGTGDWDGDSEFGSSDLILAFQSGGFELGPRMGTAAAAVPEPSTFVPLVLGGLLAGPCSRWRRQRKRD